jgi:hypothetical protein
MSAAPAATGHAQYQKECLFADAAAGLGFTFRFFILFHASGKA